MIDCINKHFIKFYLLPKWNSYPAVRNRNRSIREVLACIPVLGTTYFI